MIICILTVYMETFVCSNRENLCNVGFEGIEDEPSTGWFHIQMYCQRKVIKLSYRTYLLNVIHQRAEGLRFASCQCSTENPK